MLTNEWRKKNRDSLAGSLWRCVSLTLFKRLLLCGLMASSLCFAQETGSDAPESKPEPSADTISSPESKSASEPNSKPEPKPDLPTLALLGAEIHTLGRKGVIENGVVLLSRDRITEVGGREVEIPEGVETLDVSGLVLTPGLIDASSRLWLTTAAANSNATDASLDVLDGIDSYSDDWQEVVRHGVTTVYIQPSRDGTLGGYGAVISVVPGDAGAIVLSEHAALQASFGFGAANNKARSQQFDNTKKVFTDAADYQKKWDEYNEFVKKKEAAEKKAADAKAKSSERPSSPKGQGTAGDKSKESESKSTTPLTRTGPSEKNVSLDAEKKDVEKTAPEKTGSDSNDIAKDGGDKKEDDKKEKPPVKPKQDDAKERLAKVVNGQIPMRLEIHTADDWHYTQELLKEFPKLQVVFSGLSDLGSATDSLRELISPVVLGPWLSAESNYRQDPDSKRVWAEAFGDYGGVLVIATAGTSVRSSRLLRAHIGQAIASGIEPQAALLAVTLNAARALGVDDQIGSIEVGKRADLVCFRGHPTDSSATVALTITAGKVVHQSRSVREPKAVAAQSQKIGDLATMSSIHASRLAIKTRNYLQPDGSTAARIVVIDAEQGNIVGVESMNVEIDPEVQVVDVGDAWVTPGLYSAHATLGLNRLVDPELSDATYVCAADAITANFEGESDRVQDGMLRVLLSPGDANTIAGRASVIRLGAQEQVLIRDAAMKFSLSSSARSADRFPTSLPGQLQLIKESLVGQLLDSRLYLPKAVQERLAKQRLEKLTSVADGTTWTLISVSSDADIRAALDLVEQQKLKAALIGARQLEPFVERIKTLDVTVVAHPVSISDYNWYPQDLANAAQSGIEICFAGETADQLRLTAALATEAGMASASALAGLCYGPDALTSADSKAADLVVWSASPLDLRAKPLCVIVDGKVVSMDLEQRGIDEN